MHHRLRLGGSSVTGGKLPFFVRGLFRHRCGLRRRCNLWFCLHNFYRQLRKARFIYKLEIRRCFCGDPFIGSGNLCPWFRGGRCTGSLIQPLAEFRHKWAARVFLLQHGHGLPGLIHKTIFKVELNFDPAIFKIVRYRFFRGAQERAASAALRRALPAAERVLPGKPGFLPAAGISTGGGATGSGTEGAGA